MKIRLLPILIAAVVGLCAQANAARVYYLVGLRHIYSIPVYPDPHELDRQAIEEDYSAAVRDAQKHYDTDMASIRDEEAKDSGTVHQVDRDAVQQNLEQEIGEAADKREAAMVSIYPQVDYVRASHPQFAVDQDGPYHVVGVNTAPTGEYVEVIYYRPYPMYVDVCPFGWFWGRPYAYSAFEVQFGLFHASWISFGCPVFAPMYVGGVNFVINAPIRRDVIIGRASWVGGRPPVITASERRVLSANRVLQQKAGVFRPRTAAGGDHSVSKYSRTQGSTRGSADTARSSSDSHGTTGSHSDTGTSRTGRTGTVPPGSSKYAKPGSTSGRSDSHGSSSGGSRSGDSDKKKGGN